MLMISGSYRFLNYRNKAKNSAIQKNSGAENVFRDYSFNLTIVVWQFVM